MRPRVGGPWLLALWLAAGTPGCARRTAVAETNGSDEAGPRQSAAPPGPGVVPPVADAGVVASPSAPGGSVAQTGEARRSTIARLEADASLRPFLPVLRDHFGSAPGPFELEALDLVGGRTGLLVSRAPEADPIALVVDRDRVDWTKPRPTAGIVQPVEHLAIAPHPNGGLVVFAWVAKLRTVAARMWAEDSYPFGDFEMFAPAACDALSAAYAPGEGWIVACTGPAETRVQRMREDASLVWGREGLALGAAGGAGPATIVFDTSSTFVVVQRVAAVGGDRLVAFRYDLRGELLWPGPVQIGVLPPGGSGDRVHAVVAEGGATRIDLPRGLAGKAVRAAQVSADGSVKIR